MRLRFDIPHILEGKGEYQSLRLCRREVKIWFIYPKIPVSFILVMVGASGKLR
jgi:hypothetical protein